MRLRLCRVCLTTLWNIRLFFFHLCIYLFAIVFLFPELLTFSSLLILLFHFCSFSSLYLFLLSLHFLFLLLHIFIILYLLCFSLPVHLQVLLSIWQLKSVSNNEMTKQGKARRRTTSAEEDKHL